MLVVHQIVWGAVYYLFSSTEPQLYRGLSFRSSSSILVQFVSITVHIQLREYPMRIRGLFNRHYYASSKQRVQSKNLSCFRSKIFIIRDRHSSILCSCNGEILKCVQLRSLPKLRISSYCILQISVVQRVVGSVCVSRG